MIARYGPKLMRGLEIRALYIGALELRAGILVNHEAKLKGVAKASDYTQKPGLRTKLR